MCIYQFKQVGEHRSHVTCHAATPDQVHKVNNLITFYCWFLLSNAKWCCMIKMACTFDKLL